MYIELTKRTTYTAEIAGRMLTDLEIEWEQDGLAKLVQSATGLHLIVLRDEGLIVNGSKSLMDELWAPTIEPGYIRIKGRTIEVGKYKIEVPDFSIAQYLNCVDAEGKAYVSATETPRVNINFSKSAEACRLAGGGHIRGSQHLALAMDIMSVDANWSGGKVGEGILRRGLHRGTVSGVQGGAYVSPHADENRCFILPDGQEIYDYAGNAFQWMHDDIHGNCDGLSGKIPANSPYLVIGEIFSQAQGIGWRPDGARDWSGRALVRGGCWVSSSLSGVFNLGGVSPDDGGGDVGFRCTKP